MIIVTKTSDVMLKGILDQNNTFVSKIENIISALPLDPNNFSPAREVYVVTSDDIRNVKVKSMFLNALPTKHAATSVIFIDKVGKPIDGLDQTLLEAFLVKPKKDVIKQAFEDVIRNIENKKQVKPANVINKIEEFKPKVEPVVEDTEDQLFNPEDLVKVDVPEEQVEEAPKEDPTSLLSRIRMAENWASLNVVCQELNSSKILQELNAKNESYRQSEVHVVTLKENITAILSNPNYTVEEQLTKVRALLHDKMLIKTKTNLVQEQAIEETIMAVVDKAKEYVNAMSDEYTRDIVTAFASRAHTEAPNVRLATILEERSKLLLELTTMDVELKQLAERCKLVINTTNNEMADNSQATTGSPILDSQLKVRYGNIVPDNLVEIIDSLCKLGEDSSMEFGMLSEAITSVINKLYQLLTYYKEETEVLANTMRFLQANNVEDTVIASTIMKKARRIYAVEDSPISIVVPYLVSREQARNHNVLLIDFSGRPYLSTFGVKVQDIDTLLNTAEVIKEHFMAFGVSNTENLDMDYFNKRLEEYAHHYDVINIILPGVWVDFINTLADDSLSISYVVDSTPYSIAEFKDIIAQTHHDNVGRRVIITNYVGGSADMCKELGVLDDLRTQLSTIKPVINLNMCLLYNQDPYEVASIKDDCVEILERC